MALFVPYDSIITMEKAMATVMGEYILKNDLIGQLFNHQITLITLFLILEKKKQDASPFKHLLNLFPNYPRICPYFFNETELKLLDGCLIKSMIK